MPATMVRVVTSLLLAWGVRLAFVLTQANATSVPPIAASAAATSLAMSPAGNGAFRSGRDEQGVCEKAISRGFKG